MKRLIIAIGSVVALMLGGLSLNTASASTSVPPTRDNLKITKVGTDAMGTDTLNNRNREFVTFQNTSTADSVDLKGVLIEDNWGHRNTVRNIEHSCNKYEITGLPEQSSGVATLLPGHSVTVFNGDGDDRKVNTEYRLYAHSNADCGTAGQFYNNDADTAWVTLGKTVLAWKSWDWGGGYYLPVG